MKTKPNKAKAKGPNFVRYFGPLLDALRAQGGAGKPAELRDQIAGQLGLSDAELSETIKSGQNRFTNQVYWARFYLAKGGYIEAGDRGRWRLTPKGMSTSFSHEQAISLFRSIHKQFHQERPDQQATGDAQDIELQNDTVPNMSYRDELLTALRALPATGFELLCKHLLQELQVTAVEVTGRSGDGGIDGHGLAHVNPVVSFRVLFQCKKYAGSVSSGHVRDFRGAMQGRADKGIILTTGTFTRDARMEAQRDGVSPIELIDGERLLELCEERCIGLKPITAYEVDHSFFEQFHHLPNTLTTLGPV